MHDPGQALVDVIDDQGRTVGVVPRAEMRGKRLPHRCVYILVFNARSDLFVHLRTPTKDVYPSYWDVTVGGVLAAGESYVEGARRELREELGVDAPLEELFPFRYEDERTIVHGMVYRAQHEGPFRLQPEEIVRGEFMPPVKALQRAEKEPFCPDGMEVLRQYRDKESASRPGIIGFFWRRKPLRTIVRRWRERHLDPFNFGIHLLGIPLTIVGVVLFCALDWNEWYLGAAVFLAGYLLQWIGHLVEGNDMGEIVAIKALVRTVLCGGSAPSH